MGSEYWKGGTLISVLTNQASSPLALCIQSMMDWLTLWFLEGDILHGPMRTALVEMGASCIAVDSTGFTLPGRGKGMRSAKETIQNLRGSEELAEGGKTNPEPLNVTTLKSLQTYSDAAP